MIGTFRVRVLPSLAGEKRPILSDGILFTSPAMFDLLTHADEQELEHLLMNLHPIRIDGLVGPMLRETVRIA